MQYRSWLFVPGNSEKKLGKAVATGADAVIVDLEDSVTDEQKQLARRNAAEFLKVHASSILEQRRLGRWVRINALDNGSQWREDLLAVMPAAPDGIILPRAQGPEAVRQLAAELYEMEQRHHITAGATRIIPLVGETPLSAMKIGDYIDSVHARLMGLAWGADALGTAIASSGSHDESGALCDPFRFVRAQALLTAHACEVMAIDAPSHVVDDSRAVERAARRARADGFTGMLAVHPDQVPVINAAFTPSDREMREAREIIAAFKANPGASVLQYQGRTIDRPNLRLAERTLGLDIQARPEAQQAFPILRPA